jgi:hypothetical protein
LSRKRPYTYIYKPSRVALFFPLNRAFRELPRYYLEFILNSNKIYEKSFFEIAL